MKAQSSKHLGPLHNLTPGMTLIAVIFLGVAIGTSVFVAGESAVVSVRSKMTEPSKAEWRVEESLPRGGANATRGAATSNPFEPDADYGLTRGSGIAAQHTARSAGRQGATQEPEADYGLTRGSLTRSEHGAGEPEADFGLTR